MAERRDEAPVTRLIERQVERKGLAPRVAAGIVALFWIVAIAAFGLAEHLIDEDSFDTVWDGMWWATQTVTTVGYGDIVPQDTAGKLAASILMIGGLSFFAILTGVITSAFVARAQADRRATEGDAVLDRLDRLSAEVESLRKQLGRPAGGSTGHD